MLDLAFPVAYYYQVFHVDELCPPETGETDGVLKAFLQLSNFEEAGNAAQERNHWFWSTLTALRSRASEQISDWTPLTGTTWRNNLVSLLNLLMASAGPFVELDYETSGHSLQWRSPAFFPS